MSLLSMIKGAGPTGFGYGSTAEDVTDGLELSGRTYLVTGCNSGLGQETIRVLGRRGAHIVGAARTEEKARAAGGAAGVDLTPVACELSDPASVRAAVDAVKTGPKVHAIICNAGIMALPDLTVKDGVELQFLTNHIGHFLLVTGLLDHLADDGRIVIVSSGAHAKSYAEGIQFENLDGSKGYTGWGAYGQSKLANLLFARELAKRLPDGQVANAVHPGVIQTNLWRNMNPVVGVALSIVGPLGLKSIPEGAATQVWAAVHPDAANITGEYLKNCNVAQSSAHGQNNEMAARLWEETEKIVARL